MTGCAVCGRPTDLGVSVHLACSDAAADRALAEMVEAPAPLCKCCGVCSPTICDGAALGTGCERRCRCDEDDADLDDEAEEADWLRNGGRP